VELVRGICLALFHNFVYITPQVKLDISFGRSFLMVMVSASRFCEFNPVHRSHAERWIHDTGSDSANLRNNLSGNYDSPEITVGDHHPEQSM